VYGWCRKAGLQAVDAADVVQQVFATVAASVAQFQGGRPGDTFRGWLWTIFHSRLMDFFRHQRRRDRLVGDSAVKRLKDAEPAEPPPTTSSEDEADNAGLVRRALEIVRGDFSAATWQAFWGTAVEGQAASDVARDLGLTPAAVCMARSRVLRRLRETLAGLGLWLDDDK
jgi:RNA polymerase sigma-70 factor (ECF subfamily)